MRRPALLGFLLSFLLGFLPLAARAQTQTAVSATVTDPNGIPYANGTFSIQLIPTGNNPSVNGAAIQGAFNGSLSATGSFSASLWPNASITPASTQWQFTICSNSGGIAPPLGTGTQCTPPTAITISGTAQVLTTTLSNVAPKLTNFITGGTGSVTSVAATSPIVATPSPITGAGTLSCPTCNTSGATIAGSIANTQVAFGTAANTIGGNAGFLFVTPNLTIPTSGGYQINGVNALFTGTSANSNLAVGTVAFPALTSGTFNTAVGDQTTMAAVTSGTLNVAVGATDMSLTTTGQQNTAVGIAAMQTAAAGASKNVAVGAGALKIVTSDANTAVGQGALGFLTSGNQNTAIGNGAGLNATGSGNTVVGFSAGLNLSTGSNNVILGNGLGNAVSSGSSNVAIGVATLSNITATSSNQLDIMDVIVGTGMGTPASSTVEYKGNLTVDGTCTGCAGTPSFPVTVAGTVTSGGIPYFNSTTQESSSAALASTALVVGGGAGGAPTTGNGDFTYATHTLTSAAAGLVNLSAITSADGFRVPNIAACVPSLSGSLCAHNNYYVGHAGGQLAILLQEAATLGANVIPKNSVSAFSIQVASSITDNGTTVTTTEPVNATGYQTASTCKANGTAANPSVASCGSAAAGMFSCATNASTGTCTVNTTDVTANSSITITQNAADGGAGQLNVTCNTGNVLSATAPVLAAKVGGTSFTINLGTVTANPACFEYIIVN